LREWIDVMDKRKELVRVDGARWEDEIGAITDLYQRQPGTSALLFDQIPGYPKGFRVLSNSLTSHKRLSTTLELPVNSKPMEIVAGWRNILKDFKALPPEVKKTGPILENVDEGNKINLLKFPTPKWHELDGGRYIGTACMVITRDPDNPEWVNSGTYRVMVQDEKHAALMASPGKHGRIIRERYWARGQACPVVVVAGQDPLLYLLSGMEIPYGRNEYDFAGSIRKKPVDIIQGPTTGLPIPATAEIVLEGTIKPNDLRPEGPFGEWTGYYAGGIQPEPVITLTAVLHRNDPIMLGSSPARPPADSSYWRSPIRSALVWNELEGAGIPGVKGVWAHEAGAGRLLLIVSIEQLYPGHSRQAGLIASQCHAGAYINRWVIVVDEDVDVTDTYEVLWAAVTRCDPAEDLEILRKCWAGRLDPLGYPKGEPGFNNRMIIDACRSWDKRKEFPKVATTSRELGDRVMKDWPHLFPVR
jgi:UbiD family decarboxylase